MDWFEGLRSRVAGTTGLAVGSVFLFCVAQSHVALGEVPSESDGPRAEEPGVTEEPETSADVKVPSKASAKEQAPIPLSIIVRGGSSLGAYEAGYLYMLTEAVKRNPGLFEVKIITGASAGAMNAVIAAISLGGEPVDDPQESLFYRAWAQLDHRKVMDVESEDTPEGALSSRNALWQLADLIQAEWQKGFSEDFEIVIGASATRLKPRYVKFNDRISYDRQTEKFTYRIKGRGKNRAPEITNQIYAGPLREQALLPFGSGDEADFALIMGVAFASIGIPIVFPPQNIPHCRMTLPADDLYDPSEIYGCDPRKTTVEAFVDGGVADNHPINLAYLIGNAAFHDSVQYAPGDPAADKMHFLYLDPSHLSHFKKFVPGGGDEAPLPANFEDIVEKQEKTDIFGMLPKFLGGFIRSAQSSELDALAQTSPLAKKYVYRSKSYHHPISSAMSGKLGFFDREFIKHDFYLGMFDAKKFIRSDVREDLEEKDRLPLREIAFPGEAGGGASVDGWRPYTCMASVLENSADAESCADGVSEVAIPRKKNGLMLRAEPPDMREFRIILQATVNRLFDYCGALSHIDEAAAGPLCMAAFHQENPPEVPGVTKQAAPWYRCLARKSFYEPEVQETLRRSGLDNDKLEKRVERFCDYARKDEGEYPYVMRQLEDLGFHFNDIGLKKRQSWKGRLAMRGTLDSFISGIAKKYKRCEGMSGFAERNGGLRVAGKWAVNLLDYVAPPNIIYFTLGKGSEIAWSRAVWPSRLFRFNWGIVEIRGAESWFTDDPTASFTSAAGFELELPGISGPVAQFTVAARYGYQFNIHGLYTAESCDDRMSHSTDLCSAFVLQPFLSVAFVQRVRIQLGAELFHPGFGDLAPAKFAGTFSASIGWQFLP